MPKSRDAFRTISEVAEWLETPAHVLRFWESKFTQVKPVKRAGGRRYYRPADMQLLAGLKKLLHEDGLTIKGAQKVMREQGVKYVASLSDRTTEETETASGGMMHDASVEEAPFIDVTTDETPRPGEEEGAENTTVIAFERMPPSDDGIERETTLEAGADLQPDPAAETGIATAPMQGSLLDLLGVSPSPVAAPPEDSTTPDIPEEPSPVAEVHPDALDNHDEPPADRVKPDLPPAFVSRIIEQDMPGPIAQIAAGIARDRIERDTLALILPKLAHLAGLSSPDHMD